MMRKRRRLLLLGGLVVLAAACSGGAEPATDTPEQGPLDEPTTVPTDATETTSSDLSTASVVWSRVPHDDSVFGGAEDQRMRSVALSDAMWVAVGWDTSGGDFDAAVWTSTDSVMWSRLAHDESTFGGTDTQTMRAMAASASGFVAVGNDFSGGDFDAAVWTSPDGTAWSRIPHDEAVFGGDGDQQMDYVTATAEGVVAVGLERTDQIDAAVWSSPDGLTWSRVPHDEAVFGGESDQDMNSVTGSASGFVAVGEDWSGGDPDAAVWASPDGTTWSRVPHDEGVFGGEESQKTLSVTAWQSGFVAVGLDSSRGNFDAAAWTSPDGTTWSRVPHDEGVFGGNPNQQLDDVAVFSGGLVAVGLEAIDEDWDAAAWTSQDGVTWARVPHDEAVFGGNGNQQLLSVRAAEAQIVAVGDQDLTGFFDAAVWVGAVGQDG